MGARTVISSLGIPKDREHSSRFSYWYVPWGLSRTQSFQLLVGWGETREDSVTSVSGTPMRTQYFKMTRAHTSQRLFARKKCRKFGEKKLSDKNDLRHDVVVVVVVVVLTLTL